MSDPKDKEHFDKVIFNTLVESVRRLQTFVESGGGPSQFLATVVMNEVMLIQDKVRLLDEETYGKVIARYGMERLKVGRGFCTEDDCYRTLVPPSERCEFQPALQIYLDKWCATCAEDALKTANEVDDTDYDEDFENELEADSKNG